VARGTQHRKRRPRPNARAAAAVATTAKPRKQKPPQWQEQLFFSRLRTHAKWIYVFLAVAFAATFALLGVGSGSTGISGALQNLFSSNGTSGPSISSLQHKVQKHPRNADDWRALATAYEQKHSTTDAISALETYTALRPKDQGALQELASQYGTEASSFQTQAQDAYQQAQLADPTAAFAPPATTPLGKAFASPAGLKDPIGSVVAAAATARATTATQQYNSLIARAESTYKTLAKLSPNDASTQIQLGQAAAAASDLTTAVAAYRKFLKLAPSDPLAPQVRKVLKQLAPSKK
jgi:cytochrome c-type biogenesis protein CcmH/NrfG